MLAAKELLKNMLELRDLSNELKDWEKGFKDNPPRHYRLMKINSLMTFLNIECNYEELFSGAFISNYHTKLEIEQPVNLSEYKDKDQLTSSDLKFPYSHLLNYRLKTFSLLHHNSTIYAASEAHTALFKPITKINKLISNETGQIDEILIKITDPRNRSCSLPDLIKHHRYPNVNIDDIDIEWM